MLSTVVLIHSLPSWCSKLLQSMPSSHHLLSSCTNASLGPPSLPKSTTLNPTSPPSSQMDSYLLKHLQRQADKHCKSIAPLYASQPVAIYDILHKIWVPATVVCFLPKDSYQIHTSNGTVYCHTRWHLGKHSVKPADTVSDATTTTPQAPTRPCVSMPQPCTNQTCTTSADHTCYTHHTCNSKATGHSCSHHTSCPRGCPCAYACNIQ